MTSVRRGFSPLKSLHCGPVMCWMPVPHLYLYGTQRVCEFVCMIYIACVRMIVSVHTHLISPVSYSLHNACTHTHTHTHTHTPVAPTRPSCLASRTAFLPSLRPTLCTPLLLPFCLAVLDLGVMMGIVGAVTWGVARSPRLRARKSERIQV